MKNIILALAAFLATTPVLAADNFQALDANRVVISKRAFDTGGGFLADAVAPLDTTNTRIDPATKQLQQSILNQLPTLSGDGGALSHTANGALESGGNLFAARVDLDALTARTTALNADGGMPSHTTNGALETGGNLAAAKADLDTIAGRTSFSVTGVPNPADVVTTPPLNTGTAGTYAEFPAAGANEISVEITNLPAGAILSFQRRVGSTVYNATALPAGAGNAYVGTASANGVYHFLGGGQYIRLTVATPATGAANLTWVGSAGLGVVSVKQSNPSNLYASAVVDARLNDGAGNLLSVQFAAINASAAGSNTVVAAVAGKRIKVLGLFIQLAAADTVTFQDGATPITGPFSFLAGGGLSEATTPYGLFTTSAGNALTVNLSAAAQASGHLSYVVY